MIDEDQYCVGSILVQMATVRAALDPVGDDAPGRSYPRVRHRAVRDGKGDEAVNRADGRHLQVHSLVGRREDAALLPARLRPAHAVKPHPPAHCIHARVNPPPPPPPLRCDRTRSYGKNAECRRPPRRPLCAARPPDAGWPERPLLHAVKEDGRILQHDVPEMGERRGCSLLRHPRRPTGHDEADAFVVAASAARRRSGNPSRHGAPAHPSARPGSPRVPAPAIVPYTFGWYSASASPTGFTRARQA